MVPDGLQFHAQKAQGEFVQKSGSDGELTGKVAIVTGASRGIGHAIAELFCRSGAQVTLTGRDTVKGEAAAQGIAGANKAIFVRADQGSDTDWRRVVDATLSAFGRVDILVANAGLSYAVPTADMTLEQFRTLNTVNLKGCFLALKHAVAAMRRHKDGGAAVLMSSIVGKVGVPGYIHYAAAKDGVRLMAKAAALELGAEKIRVNSVHPGMIHTDMTSGFDEKMLAPMIPMGRFGEPRDIANAALFLASPRGKFITGTELVVDGGWIAR
jgi:3alpha(or 20beta)-hydroxysteroid dehydrogenase